MALKVITSVGTSLITNYIKYYDGQCDILIIDECSTVNNKDMLKILDKMNL